MTDATTRDQERDPFRASIERIEYRRRRCREGDHSFTTDAPSLPESWAADAAAALLIDLDEDCSAYLSTRYCLFCSTERRYLRVVKWGQRPEVSIQIGGGEGGPPPLTNPPRNAREAANLAEAERDMVQAMREIASEETHEWDC